MSQTNYLRDVYQLETSKDLLKISADELDNVIKTVYPVIKCEIIERGGYSNEIKVIIPLGFRACKLGGKTYCYVYDSKFHILFEYSIDCATRVFEPNQRVSILEGTGHYAKLDKITDMLLNNYIRKHLFKGVDLYDSED